MKNWQSELAQSITDISALAQALGLILQDIEARYPAQHDFALRVPRPYLSRIEKGNLNDPLLLQVLPQAQEMFEQAGYSRDPNHEAAANAVPGLLHKYHGRVLLTLAGSCAINCRYCFRRHFPYAENVTNWQPALDYVQRDATISEVILSGGEPLLVKDEQLEKLIAALEAIPHVKRLRIHTRLPIVIPSRITERLLELLDKSSLQTSVVLHSNHAQEIDQDVAAALLRFQPTTITLLNQAVLLKGVNDSVEVLSQLSERLYAAGVLPYYLHLLDPVQGAAHFAVEKQRALQMYQDLQNLLPGYLVPKLVQEVPGEQSKVLMSVSDPERF